MFEILPRKAANLCNAHHIVEFFCAFGELVWKKIGKRGLLAPDERAGLFEVKLARKFPVDQRERFLGRGRLRPKVIVGGHGE